MALDVAALATDLAAAFSTMYGGELPDTSQTKVAALATGLATAIDRYVRGAEVTTRVSGTAKGKARLYLLSGVVEPEVNSLVTGTGSGGLS